MYKLEEFESILRTSAAENTTVEIIFKGKPINSQKAQELTAIHQQLLQNDPAYQDLFARYKKNYLKVNDLITRIENRIPDFNRNAPSLDKWKGTALAAFHVAHMVARLPEAAIAIVQEEKAAKKMFAIYEASVPSL